MGVFRRCFTFSAVMRLLTVVSSAAAVAGCAQIELPAHLRPLSKDAMMLLGKKTMTSEAPIFIRVFKEDSELEVWKQRDDGRFYHYKSYPICNWSGDLGPKTKQGDKQAPEGFYQVNRNQMNPNSQFHLAFNLGFPNAYDRAHGRTGEFLMVHGKCKSAGCYAMTDALIEEIYALAREAFIGGQEVIEVHAFPFRMTEENMQRVKKHEHYRFWKTLKEGYDHFEMTRQPPPVAVCERRYVVNVKWSGGRPEPDNMCPAFERPMPDPFVIKANQQVAEERVVAPGPRMRTAAQQSDPIAGMLGLTRSWPSGYRFNWFGSSDASRPSQGIMGWLKP